MNWLKRLMTKRRDALPAAAIPIQDREIPLQEVSAREFCSATRATDANGNLIWPDDPDEVPAWRLALEERSMLWGWDAQGICLPPYRTRREMEHHNKLSSRISLAEDFDDGEPMLPALSPDEAAAEFLDWLRLDGLVGEFSALELSQRYVEFCLERNLTETPDNQVKAALALLPGVYRDTTDVRIDGKRRRAVRWVIDLECGKDLGNVPANDVGDAGDACMGRVARAA